MYNIEETTSKVYEVNGSVFNTEKEAEQYIRKLLYMQLMMMAQAGEIQLSEDFYDFIPSNDYLVKEFSCIKLLDGSSRVRDNLKDIICDLEKIGDIDATNNPFENGLVGKTYMICTDSEAYLYFDCISIEDQIASLQEILHNMKTFNDSMKGSENINEEK